LRIKRPEKRQDVGSYDTYQSGTLENGADAHLDALIDPTFRAGGLFDFGNAEARAHADIWVLYRMVFEYLEAFGAGYGFDGQVRVKYPHDGIAGDEAEASYANPVNNVIYIVHNSDEDHFNTPTLLHELMHMWAYHHSRGEDGMAWDLVGVSALTALGLLDGDLFDTHGFETNTGVAFHEGFAEFAAIQVFLGLFGEDLAVASPIWGGFDIWLPFNRTAFTERLDIFDNDFVASIAQAEHYDDGWQSMLAAVVLDNPERYEFGLASTMLDTSLDGGHFVSRPLLTPAVTCPRPQLSFREVLRVFMGPSIADRADDWRMDDMTWAGFTARARALGLLGADDVAFYDELLEPMSPFQPDDLLDCSLIIAPIR
jgi:hypothetical protein